MKVRIFLLLFLFIFFNFREFPPICCLRDENDSQEGGGAAGCTLLTEGFFPLGRAEIQRDSGWGVRGWAQLLSRS